MCGNKNVEVQYRPLVTVKRDCMASDDEIFHLRVSFSSLYFNMIPSFFCSGSTVPPKSARW